MPDRPAAAHLPGLDLLRAVAVVWVMLFHSFVVGGLGSDFDWLSRFGWMGVDIFFVLSGFLIGSPLLARLRRGAPLALTAFYRRRAYRILPAYFAMLALYVGVPAWREAPGLQPWWHFATFIVNLTIDYGRNPAFSHAWSLCVEEHFYLLCPLLVWALTRRPSARVTAGVCAAVVLGGIALRSAVWLHDSALDPPRAWFIEDLYDPTWMRLDGLLAGVLLAAVRVWQPSRWARWQRRPDRLLVAGLALLGLAMWLFRDRVGLVGNAIGWPVLAAAVGVVVVAGASRTGWIGGRALPGAGWLAGISYSLYLSHKMVFHVVQTALGPWLDGRGLVAFMVYAAAALAGGLALHHGIERPFLRLRDRRAAPQRPDAERGATGAAPDAVERP